MDIETLHLFLRLSENLSFSTTAAAENISQSSLSKSIMRLEEELGVRLFDRSSHPIVLTTPGRILAAELGDLEPGFTQLIARVKKYGHTEDISLFLVPSALSFNFRHTLWAFSQIHPDIKIQQEEREELSEINGMLQDGTIDYVITRRMARIYPRYRRTLLDYDEILVVMPPNHPLAGSSEVSLEDLAKEKFFVSDYSVGIMEHLKITHQFMPYKVVHKPGEKVHISLAGLGHRDGVSIFLKSDLRPFSTEEVAVARIRGIQQLPIVLLENEECNSREVCRVFKEYLLSQI